MLALAACAERKAPPVEPPAPPPGVAIEANDAGPPALAVVEDAAAPVVDAASPAETRPQVTSNQVQGWIYEQPRPDALKAGYIRVGAKIARSAEPVKGLGCHGRWFSVEPGGFVCDGEGGITLDMNDPVAAAVSAYPPKIDEPFPYKYATSWGAPLYARLPTREQQRKIEGNIEERRANLMKVRDKLSEAKKWPLMAMEPGPVPSFYANGAQAPRLNNDEKYGADAVAAGHAWPTMRPSLLYAFEHEGRAFYLTSELFAIPADRMRPAKLTDFKGIELADGGEHLPMVFVNWKPAPLFKLENGAVKPAPGETMDFQAHAMINGKEHVRGATKYYELSAPPPGARDPSGTYLVPAHSVSRADAATELPINVGRDELWIDISIGKQHLVLYKGLTPIFITLVSTGVDGAMDPEKTRSTPRGLFRIHSKHVTSRMRGDEKPPQKEGDKPDPRYRVDDVPYVQFFHAGYALHGAYWHDAFGQPKSHGCINLSPRDALWLFQHTTPNVPQGWHGVYSGRAGAEKGTWINIRAH
jgi:hypothetical protein